MKKTWKQKIGKRLLKHVHETTTYHTLREVRSNLHDQCERGIVCHECDSIARKLGLPV